MNVIDPHIHLFDVELGDYGWLKPSNPPFWPDKPIINRSFNDADLNLNSLMSLSGFVHIEAGFNNAQPWLEIEWLEEQVSIPFKAIASADITLAPNEFMILIDKLKNYKNVVGIRHIFDDETVDILRHQNTPINLAYLAQSNLIFETQIEGCDEEAVTQYCGMAKSHETLTLILSHANFCPSATKINDFDVSSKETIENQVSDNETNDNKILQWRNNIVRLALNKNVSIKASGWEMVARDYTLKHVENVISFLVAKFGVERVMLASNFPLTLFSHSYNDLWQSYLTLNFDEEVLNQLMHDNAKRIYKIS